MKKILKDAGEILGLGMLSFLMMGQVVRGAEAKNLFKNPGFEEVKPFTVPEQWQGKV